MSSLPDDWNAHWAVCHDCGARYHRSGVYECECQPCAVCGELVPPDEDCALCEDRLDEVTDQVMGRSMPEQPVHIAGPLGAVLMRLARGDGTDMGGEAA